MYLFTLRAEANYSLFTLPFHLILPILRIQSRSYDSVH